MKPVRARIVAEAAVGEAAAAASGAALAAVAAVGEAATDRTKEVHHTRRLDVRGMRLSASQCILGQAEGVRSVSRIENLLTIARLVAWSNHAGLTTAARAFESAF